MENIIVRGRRHAENFDETGAKPHAEAGIIHKTYIKYTSLYLLLKFGQRDEKYFLRLIYAVVPFVCVYTVTPTMLIPTFCATAQFFEFDLLTSSTILVHKSIIRTTGP